jgi:hypothetical protein
MATAATIQLANTVIRPYGRSLLQAIGRADLVGEFNAPINTTEQLQDAVNRVDAAAEGLMSEWVPAMDAYTEQASDLNRAETDAEVASSGLTQAWFDLNEDVDGFGRAYVKAVQRCLIRARTIDLYNQSQT